MDTDKQFDEKDKGVDNMIDNGLVRPVTRYCSIPDSLIQSCKEVKKIRAGKLPKKTWKELRDELKALKDD
ncbi:MAG: hypothetical protein E7569_05585 [Ruminococcaceae bacterium]|nr:hypothetical protein [Oscillospiraceae bacterium]